MQKTLYWMAATWIVIARLKYGTLFVGAMELLTCHLVLLGVNPQEEVEEVW